MAIKSLGVRNILLTDKETLCFKITCRYRRRALVKSLFDQSIASPGMLARLHWSKNIIVAILQVLVIVILLPFIVLSMLLKGIYRLLLFPFRYLKTFIIPRDLVAPGEKTLVGIHNTFSRYTNVGVDDYIACLNEWIVVLYGSDVLARNNLEGYLESEISRLRVERSNMGDSDFSPTVRRLLANRRERLSRTLGHYGKPKGKKARSKVSA